MKSGIRGNPSKGANLPINVEKQQMFSFPFSYMVVRSVFMHQKYFFASCLSSLGRGHVGALFNS